MIRTVLWRWWWAKCSRSEECAVTGNFSLLWVFFRRVRERQTNNNQPSVWMATLDDHETHTRSRRVDGH